MLIPFPSIVNAICKTSAQRTQLLLFSNSWHLKCTIVQIKIKCFLQFSFQDQLHKLRFHASTLKLHTGLCSSALILMNAVISSGIVSKCPSMFHLQYITGIIYLFCKVHVHDNLAIGNWPCIWYYNYRKSVIDRYSRFKIIVNEFSIIKNPKVTIVSSKSDNYPQR